MFTLKVDIAPELQQAFKRLQDEFPNDVAAALYNEATHIAHAAMARAPHESGDLQKSAYVTRPHGQQPTVELGFGSPYAAYIHERTDLHHTSGESKFLQKALDAEGGSSLQRMAAELQPAFERGGRVTATGTLPSSPPAGVEKRHDTSRRGRFNASVRRR